MHTETHPDQPANPLDRAVHLQISRFTQGLSPAAMVGAYMDWLVHLAMSPGKQQELVSKAVRKATRLALHATHASQAAAEPCAACIDPLPQDRRFAAPEWQQWPFNLIYQSFLLNQQWWHNATTDVPGVTAHHQDLVTFFARQWLDMFSPSNFLATNPEALAVTARRGGANLVEGARLRLAQRQREALGQPPAGTEAFRPGHEVAVTPGKVVFRNHLIELLQYSPSTETVYAEPLLMVPSWILKYYIMDLSPGNSLVKYLVDRGHTVFMISWKNPDAADRNLGMDDYLKSGVLAALDAVCAIVPQQRVQALGYCLGGTLLAMAAALLARDQVPRLASLTLLASELDFTEPGELGLFIDESQLAFLDSMMADQGYLDGKQMAGTFTMLNSRDLLWSRMEREYLLGQTTPMNDLMAWNADTTRMPARQHSQYLRSLYLHNDLAEGRYSVDGRPIALSDIRIPVFALGTQRDTVSPWHAVYKIHLLTDTDVSFCLTSGGHNVGVVNPPGPGVKRHYQLTTRAADAAYVDPDTWAATTASHEGSWWPAWADWLAQSAGKQVAPPAMGRQAAGDPPLDDAPGRYVLMR